MGLGHPLWMTTQIYYIHPEIDHILSGSWDGMASRGYSYVITFEVSLSKGRYSPIDVDGRQIPRLLARSFMNHYQSIDFS